MPKNIGIVVYAVISRAIQDFVSFQELFGGGGGILLPPLPYFQHFLREIMTVKGA